MSKIQRILAVAGLIVVILLGVYFIYNSHSKNINTQFDTSTNTSSTTANVQNNSTTGSYKIEQVALSNNGTPDLNRPIVYGKVSDDAKRVSTEKINTIISYLKKDPAVWDNWINLGIYQKMAGDYQGTVLSWVYASKIAPNDFVSLGDLGDLYAYFLKDSKLSIQYYNMAITKSPSQAYLYIQLAQVYRDVVGDPEKSKGTIEQGLSQLPNDPNLKAFLDSFSK